MGTEKSQRSQSDDEMLIALQAEAYAFFQHETNFKHGLVVDSTAADSPCSIASVGLATTCNVVAAQNGLIHREEALEGILTTLRFFSEAPQGPQQDATGYHGFYYHFLDMEKGRRTWNSELSSIDTAFLVAGFLCAAQFFDHDTPREREIRERAEAIYDRIEWDWMLGRQMTLAHGWKPESGFLRHRWQGYNEALLLYILAEGSLAHPIPEASYHAWTSTYRWIRVYEHEYLFSAPLFTHQLSHCWIDFRQIQDAYMRSKAIDYFENSRRATYIQRAYAEDNPMGWTGYCGTCWGFTASDGPGPASRTINGERRTFFAYKARGAPHGPDDGTIAPWAAVTSLPFAPEIVLPTLHHFMELDIGRAPAYGFEATFNETFKLQEEGGTWVSSQNYGLNQGPLVIMLENYRSGLIWRLMRGCPQIERGLRRAGFRGGWLG